MRRRNDQRLYVLTSTGIFMDIQSRGRYLNLRMEVSGRYRGTNRVRGIFGNFDRDRTNDFSYRDMPNAPLSNNMNNRQIYNVIQTCKFLKVNRNLFNFVQIIFISGALRNRNESMFMYPDENGQARKKRQSFDDFQNVTVDPIYPEDLNFTDEQRELCNNDTQCLLDLVVTNDTDVALATLNVNENMTMEEELLCEDYLSLTIILLCIVCK